MSKWDKNKKKQEQYMFALYDENDCLFCIGNSKKELAKYLEISPSIISDVFTPNKLKMKFRYRKKWYTKHVISLKEEEKI